MMSKYQYDLIESDNYYSIMKAIDKEGNEYTCYQIDRRANENTTFGKLFRKYIEIIGSLDHENIQKYIECVFEEENLGLIVEYQAYSFFAIFKSGKSFDEDSFRPIFVDLMKGIQYLHQNGIAHLDIRPESLFFCKEKKLKICNFINSEYIPENGQVSCPYGTNSYQAPEIFCKKPYCAEKADVWACGILLLSTLIGRNALKKGNDQEILQQISSLSIPKYLSGEVSDLLSKMINIDPSQRIPISKILSHNWCKSGATFLKSGPNRCFE